MTHEIMKRHTRIAILLVACSALTACGTADRIANIGKAPEMSTIANPVTKSDYQPVSLPMPAPKNAKREKNSLWASDRQAFFQDQRASDVGDIITVMIDISDEAELENESARSRTGSEDAQLPALLGLEGSLGRVLPEAIDPGNLIDFDSTSNHSGTGSVEREEEVELQLAAIITQILPNGNMVIHGSQEVLVNFEKRIVQIDGVIRPEDISVENTIASQQIAEARIIYGGEGQITDVQQPRYGKQLYDIVFPF